METKPCKCGCKTMIDIKDSNGRIKSYVHGHNSIGKNHPMYGRKQSPESIEKMRIASLGRIPWNKGRTETRVEVLEKQKNSHFGKLRGKDSPNWITDRSKIKTYDKRTDSSYKQWVKSVKNRDCQKCKINNENCNGRLEIHHILGFSSHPELRYDINNGITLCHYHHPTTRKKEAELSPYFKELIKQ